MEAWAVAHGFAVRYSTQAVAGGGLVVEGSDVITAKTGTCPDVVLTIRGVPVAVNIDTVFGTGVTCGTLATGQTIHVIGLLTITDDKYSVVATSIAAPSPTPVVVHEITGIVTSATGTCPALTIGVEGTAVLFTTTSATTFTPSSACPLITAGKIIQAKGTRNESGQFVATEVSVEGLGGGHGPHVAGEGPVDIILGACPSLTLTVRGVIVRTNASTAFENGVCGDVRQGTRIAAQGIAQPDGSITAASVRITDQPGGGHGNGGPGGNTTPPAPVPPAPPGNGGPHGPTPPHGPPPTPSQVQGHVGHLRGSCPALSFKVRGTDVTTTGTTTFSGGACSAIRNGSGVNVSGTVQGSTLVASAVTIN